MAFPSVPHRFPSRRSESLLGNSVAMQEVFRLIERVGPTEASVLLTGESGSGKELAAQMIHECSARRGKPFIAINCGAIPAGPHRSRIIRLRERQLHGRGARARRRIRARARRHAAARRSNRNAVGHADTAAARARVPQVLPGRREHRIHLRRARHRRHQPLSAAGGASGQLREDLLYRLAVFPIDMPPLRNRGDDVELLANHFLGGTQCAGHDAKAAFARTRA